MKKYRITKGHRMLGSIYRYPIGKNSLAFVVFHDDVQRGIAFKEAPTINAEVSSQLEAIVVHRPGYRILPEEGYTLYTIDDKPWMILKNGSWEKLN